MTQLTARDNVDDRIQTLGPDSMLWRYAGDCRTYLAAPMTGLLLNMLPGVSAGIEQHSTFFDEPWARTIRSISQIMQTVYDPYMALRVRDYHHQIKGIDHHGHRYHALSPELYFASHAVFTYTVITVVDTFDHRLSDAEKRELYADCKLWYRQYGVSDRDMPVDWEAFSVYWDNLCSNVLEATPVARRIVEEIYPNPNTVKLPRLPRPLYLLLRPMVTDQATLLATALAPEAVRQTLNLDYGRLDRSRFAAEAALVRRAGRVLPPRLRETAHSRAAKQRTLRAAH